MENISFLKMDIFFVVTTSVVVLLGLLGALVLFYFIKILRGVQEIIGTVKKETVEIAADFREVRREVKEGVQDVREGLTSAAHYTKAVAGAGIVKAVSALFDAFVQEKAARTERKSGRSEKKRTTK